MSEESTNKTSTAFWVIAGAMLVWNLIGLMFYYQQATLTAEVMAGLDMTQEQIAHILATPKWGHSGYAIAVNAGVLGAIFLLLRKAWAVPMFVLSLVGALVQDLDAFVLRDAMDAWGTGAVALPLLVIVICVVEIWYSRAAKEKGLLT